MQKRILHFLETCKSSVRFQKKSRRKMQEFSGGLFVQFEKKKSRMWKQKGQFFFGKDNIDGKMSKEVNRILEKKEELC